MNAKDFCIPTSIIILISLCGCTSTHEHHVVVPPPEPFDGRSPTSWRITGTEHLAGECAVNAQTQPIAENTIQIRGRVHNATQRTRITEERDMPVQEYDQSGRRWFQKWRSESRQRYDAQTSSSLKSIRIEPSTGDSVVVALSDDGSFSADIRLQDDLFVLRPKVNKYARVVEVGRKHTAMLIPQSDRVSYPSSRVELPMLYVVELDRESIRDHVLSMIASIDIQARDKDTRSNIMPTMTISVMTGTGEDIERHLKCELDGSAVAMEYARGLARDILKDKERLVSMTDTMRFSAWKGFAYRIEATHPRYFYFDKRLSVDTGGSISKEILLIERGQKVRTETITDGAVGEMIDTR